MQDIKTDFYKRFSNKTDTAYTRNTPAAVCLFGGVKGCLYEAGLALSFGSHAAFRKRNDGRVVLSRSDSDSAQSVNIAELDRFHGADWAAEILTSARRLPTDFGGFEMLIHSDCGLPSFSPHLLCSLSAICDMYSTAKPLDILSAAKARLYYLPSISGAKAGIVNALTRETFTYNPVFESEKIIAVITDKPKESNFLSRTFTAREDKRTIAAADCLAKGNTADLGTLMRESSDDLLALFNNAKLETLFRLANDYTKAVKLLPDQSGAVCFVKDSLVDEFVKIVGDRHEKKTGTFPAFYISD